MASIYTELAKKSIEYYLDNHEIISKINSEYDLLKTKKAGCFVSLHIATNLRGCIGTILPTRKNLAEEIINNAVSAAFKDPRFPPLKSSEFNSIRIKVDVLSKPKKITDKSMLDPNKYGVIVSKGYKKGVLLPDLDGVDTYEKQLEIALNKAGIYDDDYEIEIFEVKRFE